LAGLLASAIVVFYLIFLLCMALPCIAFGVAWCTCVSNKQKEVSDTSKTLAVARYARRISATSLRSPLPPLLATDDDDNTVVVRRDEVPPAARGVHAVQSFGSA
jgi:hypothetical protein